jgi:hypothetical protein
VVALDLELPESAEPTDPLAALRLTRIVYADGAMTVAHLVDANGMPLVRLPAGTKNLTVHLWAPATHARGAPPPAPRLLELSGRERRLLRLE